MWHAAAVGALLALAGNAQPGGATLWLVEPLYPGQDLLVTRSEQALDRMIKGGAIKDQVVGQAALAAFLKGKKADLRCLTGDDACADPIDALVGALGFERVVLVKGGQEDAAYRFRVTSYLPQTGESVAAEGSGASLERALLAAMVRVVPLASTLEVDSQPAGATVFVDGEKVGVTPYSGQVLPGERTVKLELASYQGVERKIEIPLRGKLRVDQKLEKVPARLVLAVQPPGTRITLDGQPAGQDKLDKPVQPGSHRLLLEAEGYLPASEDVEVQPGATLTLERRLEPTRWTSMTGAMDREQEKTYGLRSSFVLSYEQAWMHGTALFATENPFKDGGLLARAGDRANSPLAGASVEYHQDGRWFGLTVVGLGYSHSLTPWRFSLENSRVGSTSAQASVSAITVRALQPHLRLALWRFTLSGQIGFEPRLLYLVPLAGDPSQVDLFVVDVQATAQIGLRVRLTDGLFLEGVFRQGWTDLVKKDVLSRTAAFQGFHAGVGYGF